MKSTIRLVRNAQNNNLEITYDSLTIDDVKGILSKQNIGWNEIKKNRIVGHDYDVIFISNYLKNEALIK